MQSIPFFVVVVTLVDLGAVAAKGNNQCKS